MVILSPAVAQEGAGLRSGEASPSSEEASLAVNTGVAIEKESALSVSSSPRGSEPFSEEAKATGAENKASGKQLWIPARKTVGRAGERKAGPLSPALKIPPVAWYRTGLGSLAIVLVLVGLVFWFLRRWIPSVRSLDGDGLRVIGRTNLSPKHHVALVQAGRRVVMIGVGGDRLTLLSEFTDEEEVSALIARSRTDTRPSEPQFAALLRREAYRYDAEPEEPAGPTGPEAPGKQRPSASMAALLRKVQRLQAR